MNVSSISQASSVSQAAQAPPPPPPRPKAQAPVEDSVQISSAARQAIAQKPAEATETPAQTAQEAAQGDPMALAKLAKEKSSLQ